MTETRSSERTLVTADAGTPGPAPTADRRRRRLAIGPLIERYGLVIAWLAVIAFFGAMRPDEFLTTANLSTILGSQAVLGMLTLALILPLTAGDYDVSVAAVATLSAMVLAILNVQEGWPLGAAILAALGVGLVAGTINGAIMYFFKIDPFIITLGTSTLIAGIVQLISHSTTVSGVSSTLTDAVGGTKLLGVSLGFWYTLAVCVLLWWFLEYTTVGRRVLFVGRGRNVARLTGIDPDRVRWAALIASGGLAGLAGVLYVGTIGGADPSSGLSFLLPAFSAAFLGATAISPGRFNPWGSLIALYFLVTGITGLTIMGLETWVQDVFYGASLVLAVILSQLARKRRALS